MTFVITERAHTQTTTDKILNSFTNNLDRQNFSAVSYIIMHSFWFLIQSHYFVCKLSVCMPCWFL